MEGGKKAEQTLPDEKSKGKQKMVEQGPEAEGDKSKAKQKMEELFKQASEFDSMFGSKSAIVVFGSDGKVRSSSGDVKSVFDLFASRMMDVDDDDEDDEDDEEEDGDEDLEEMIHEFCKKSESEIVELKKAALAEKDVEKKKKLEEEVVKKTEEYESTIEDLEKNVDAGINRMRGGDDRKSNGGGPFSSSST